MKIKRPHLRRPLAADLAAMQALLAGTADEGDSLPFLQVDRAMIDQQWLHAAHCWVVDDDAGHLAAMYRMGPNMPGRGDHVASATYVVRSDRRGRGIGRALVEHSLEQATAHGYAGMQFNYVVASNGAALSLYERLGFAVLGRVPMAFRHDTLGPVDALILFRALG